jgi:Cysteine protease
MYAYLPDPLTVSYPTSKYWKTPPALSQIGNSCVGYSSRTDLEAAPVEVPANVGPNGSLIYQEAQKRDGLPLPHEGTSLVAAGQYLKQAGFWSTYVWAQSIDDIIKWVLLKGPVILGTVWCAGMDAYDSQYVIHPTGAVRGGHAYGLVGYDQKSGYFLVKNTWGRSWANLGRVHLFWKDAEDLVFRRAGEAVAPTEPGM